MSYQRIELLDEAAWRELLTRLHAGMAVLDDERPWLRIVDWQTGCETDAGGALTAVTVEIKLTEHPLANPAYIYRYQLDSSHIEPLIQSERCSHDWRQVELDQQECRLCGVTRIAAASDFTGC